MDSTLILEDKKTAWNRYTEERKKVVFEMEHDLTSKKEVVAELCHRSVLKDKELESLQYRLTVLTEQRVKEKRELEIAKSCVSVIESNFENERKELEHSESQVEDLERKIGALTVAPGSLELQQLEQLEGRVASKVEELECPVCFTTCSPPIYTCPNQHLVCSTCRPHLATCPECRVTYGGQMRVHRYS